MSKCELPGCDKEARRKFCSNKHKDRYHNLNNPRGIYEYLKHGPLGDEMSRKCYKRPMDFMGYGHVFASGEEGHGQD